MDNKFSTEQALMQLRRKEVQQLTQLTGMPLNKLSDPEADQMSFMYALMFVLERRQDKSLNWNDFDPTIEEVNNYFADEDDANLEN